MRRWTLALVALTAFGFGCSNLFKGDVRDTSDSGGEDTGTVEEDLDGDGWTVSEGDCDDGDPLIHPGADEICDGIDNDCDGVSDADEDTDGDQIPDCEDECPVYVDDDATGTPSGTPWAPYADIQDAVDRAAATVCGDVLVRPGNYPPFDFGGADVYVASTDGPARTTIEGDGTGPVVTAATGESHLSGIEGFTITGGGGIRGAGIYVHTADPDIVGNVITGNDAVDDGVVGTPGCLGGGIYMRNSSSWVYDNDITGNSACPGGIEEGSDGGGIYAVYEGSGGGPIFDSNRITYNDAGDGGGIWVAYSNGWILNNLVAGNTADDAEVAESGQGGGINVQIGRIACLVEGNLVVANTASTHGGGISLYENQDSIVLHNTVAFNDVTDPTYAFGGGILVFQRLGGSVIVRDNAIFGNGSNGVWINVDDGTLTTPRAISFHHNGVYGNGTNYVGPRGDLTGIDGNVSTNPLFVVASDDGNWSNDDFRLQSGSPYRLAGSDATDIGATGGTYPYY